jgi:mRNA interferase MazF
MLQPGEVVLCDFLGAQGLKRRPAVAISTQALHSAGADAVAGELTTQRSKATQPTSYELQDWAAAGLRYPSVFRCYFSMIFQADAVVLGRLSDRDWQEVQARLRLALAVP